MNREMVVGGGVAEVKKHQTPLSKDLTAVGVT